MKKLLMILMAVALLSGLVFAQDNYYNRNNRYDNYSYADYEFRHSNAAFHMDRFHGDVYYFHHYRANVYFVLVGPHTFVVPGYTFRAYMDRPNFHWVPRESFISLSAVSLPYYDSHVRFNYYSSYYDSNPWSIMNHYRVTRNYRKHYNCRHRSKRYYRNQRRVMSHRHRHMGEARRLRTKHKGHYRGNSHGYSGHDSHYRDHRYDKSRSHRYEKRRVKKHRRYVNRDNYKSASRSSQRRVRDHRQSNYTPHRGSSHSSSKRTFTAKVKYQSKR